MPITTIFRRLRQRVRNIKRRLIRRASGDAVITTALSTTAPEVTDNREDNVPRTERPRYSTHTSSGRSTPLIYRGAPSTPIPHQDEDRTSIFSFRRTPDAEILSVAPAIRDDGTLQHDTDLVPESIVPSVTGLDLPASSAPEVSADESQQATAPSAPTPTYLLPSEQEESAEETRRKREAALRMLEGEIPAVATGAYVRLYGVWTEGDRGDEATLKADTEDKGAEATD